MVDLEPTQIEQRDVIEGLLAKFFDVLVIDREPVAQLDRLERPEQLDQRCAIRAKRHMGLVHDDVL